MCSYFVYGQVTLLRLSRLLVEILRLCPSATEIQFGDDGQWKALCDNDKKGKNTEIDMVAGKSLVKIVELVDNCMQYMR